MAVTTTAVARAQCDACPAVNYADAPAEPRGIYLEVRDVNGNGELVTATAYACQPNHVGKAVQNVTKAVRESQRGTRPAAPAPAAPAPAAGPSLVRPEQDKTKDGQDRKVG